MSVTVASLQTSLAYRMGENSAPNDTNEKNRRLSFLNEGYRAVMSKHYWWFTESTGTFSTVADQDSYGSSDGVPNFRLILELRFQDTKYTKITQAEAMSSYKVPYKEQGQSYFVFNQKIYPVPPFSSTVSNGVTIKYFAGFTALTSDSDTILIPDLFSDILVAYAYARVNMVKGKRGSASDGFDEYTELLGKMTEEHNKYHFSLKPDEIGDSLESVYA